MKSDFRSDIRNVMQNGMTDAETVADHRKDSGSVPVEDPLSSWLENPYWAGYYNGAPSKLCREYIALQLRYRDTEDEKTACEMDCAEDRLELNDWKYLLKFTSCNPERAKIVKRIRTMEMGSTWKE